MSLLKQIPNYEKVQSNFIKLKILHKLGINIIKTNTKLVIDVLNPTMLLVYKKAKKYMSFNYQKINVNPEILYDYMSPLCDKLNKELNLGNSFFFIQSGYDDNVNQVIIHFYVQGRLCGRIETDDNQLYLDLLL